MKQLEPKQVGGLALMAVLLAVTIYFTLVFVGRTKEHREVLSATCNKPGHVLVVAHGRGYCLQGFRIN